MNIKSVTLTVAIVVFVAIISALISNYISERKLRPISSSAVSYEQDKGQQPAEVLESIVDKPVLQVEEKIKVEYRAPLTETQVQYQPISAREEGIELEYYEESVSDRLYDDVQTGVESEEGPPAHKIVRSLPIFKPIFSDAGPVPKDLDETQSKLSETTDSDLSEFTEQDDYAGPSVSPDIESKPLPSFAPVANKIGPIAAD